MNDVSVREEKKLERIQPPCSICEEEGQVRLQVEMPGVDKDGITVRVEKNELIIEGHPSFDDPSGTWLLRERRRGDFFKRFIIDDTIDRDSVDARIQDGVLELTLHTRESAKPRKIEIK